MRSTYFLLLIALLLQASAFYETELGQNEECEKWEYYPIGEFLTPKFITAPLQNNADQNETKLPKFALVDSSFRSDHGDIEMLDELQDQKFSGRYATIEQTEQEYRSLEEFHGPQFERKSDNVEKQTREPNNFWPIAQFFLDLIGSQPNGNRSKRFLISLPDPGDGIWKLVCVKRRPKIGRTLTAADFAKSVSMTNNRISRCIGHKVGENVAAGLCKKFYLRCSPSITVMMCSQFNEVFSEAKKTCVHNSELTECEVIRTIESNAIGLSQKSKGSEYGAIEDPQKFCQTRVDGFYQDSKNCSRIIQCFDKEFVEYPPCLKSLVFYPKREKCDYSSNVSSCII